MEVEPFLGVVLHELSALRLLCHYQISGYFSELTALEVVEIAPGQELGTFGHVAVVPLAAEYVLLLQGIALAERLDDVCQHVLKNHVTLRVGTQPENRIYHFKDDRGGPLCVEQHDITVRFLQLGVYPVEDFFVFLCHSMLE